jgi:hypothetical protein
MAAEKSSKNELHLAPTSIVPGPEVRVLDRFCRSGTLKGAARPGVPGMEPMGKGTCEWVMDGLWLSCVLEMDEFAVKEKVIAWQTRLMIGWDSLAKEYRAVSVDSEGIAALFRGQVQGNTLVMETPGDLPVRMRLTWDITPTGVVAWKRETKFPGGPWNLQREYRITPDNC